MAQVTSEQFLAALEEKHLLPPDIIDLARSRALKSSKPLPASDLAQWLIAQGHLSAYQAERALKSASEGNGPVATSASAAGNRTSANAADDELVIAEEELEIIDDELESVDELEPVDELETLDDDPEALEDDLEVVEDQPAASPWAASYPSAAQPAAGSPFGSPPSYSGLAGPASAGLGQQGLGHQGLGQQTLGKPALGSAAGKRRIGEPRNVWDSPLLLIFGGLLLALVIALPVLYLAIGRQTGDEAFAAAEADYNNASYSQAVHKYNQYLENFPDHKDVSKARVNRGLSQMRQAIDGTRNWPRALEVSKEVLAEITQETEFATAHAELSVLLPKVASGLSDQARTERRPELVTQARDALGLVQKYVPRSQQPGDQLQEIEASLQLTTRALDQGKSLDEAIKKIGQAVSDGQPARAYELRNALLKDYPELSLNAALEQAVVAASQSERDLVKFVSDQREAATGEPESPLTASLVLPTRVTAGPEASGQEQVITALVEGAVYGFGFDSGQVLWRRWVGYDGHPALPLPGASGDALLLDSSQSEIVRMETATGKSRWRLKLDEPLAGQPALGKDVVLAATPSGRVLIIDANTGASAGHVLAPQQLQTGPATDHDQRLIYQVGSQTNLYVINIDGGECREVVYLGHEPGTIRVPPVVVSRYIAIAENTGLQESVLRILLTDAEGLSPRQVQEIKLDGRVQAPPIVAGRTLLASTDRGALYTFEVGTPDQENPFTLIAQKAASGASALVRFALAQGGECWIAGESLTKYDIQAAQGALKPQWIKHEEDVFTQPLVAAGQTLFHVRRKSGAPGVAVSAAQLTDGSTIWETQLGSPLADLWTADAASGAAKALNGQGLLFDVAVKGMPGPSIAGPPQTGVDLPQGLIADGGATFLSGGLAALRVASRPNQLFVIEPQSSAVNIGVKTMPDEITGPLATLGQWLLIPGKFGQVHAFDPRGQQPRLDPFQPAVESGAPLSWRGQAVPGKPEAVLSDGRAKIYRVGVVDSPRPHLAALAETGLAEPTVSPIAIAGSTAYAVDANSRVLSFRLPSLEKGEQWPLNGPAVWGPQVVGDRVLLATQDRLYCLSDQEKMIWEQPLPYGPLCGRPVAVAKRFVLASKGGVVWLISAEGEELSKVDLGQPLAGNLLVTGNRLSLPGQDGTVHVMELAKLKPVKR